MARIRRIIIKNFRSIRKLDWVPTSGLNCIVGPGDTGKTTILDAIDLCLGARRNVQFSDADFHALDVSQPIEIVISIGELDEPLKMMDAYGQYLRGFNLTTGQIEDEPAVELDTILTVGLTVADDLEPAWSLYSDRAAAAGQSRNLIWADRQRLAPSRIGELAVQNLGWRRGSVLTKLSEEKPEFGAFMTKAARDAREAFGDEVKDQLKDVLEIVTRTAGELGISVGSAAKAMLEAQSVSLTGGAISLHDEGGVPLRSLGVGSSRLLLAGLQREASKQSTMLLIDEMEHGLEPHRIARLLESLEVKADQPKVQTFTTTHSPVVVREISGAQLWIMRRSDGDHDIQLAGTDGPIQGALRLFPEAFLARSVIVCEGASEVGLLRGLSQYGAANGSKSIETLGGALVDSGGVSKIYGRATAFLALGYRTMVLRDDDEQPDPLVEADFLIKGGKLVKWRPGYALEDELFQAIRAPDIDRLLDYAVDIHGDEHVSSKISTISQGAKNLASARGDISTENRALLGTASRAKKSGWFKQVGWMEHVGREILGPGLAELQQPFQDQIRGIYDWLAEGL
ncbi:ATP-dependent nuclease [Sphingopyxis sp. R3-92]|uniref:ATP-dependent nuclease n=1 Tax=Sphingopyxis sp. R3-92 TaxID=3158553 RepID=UPI003EE63794